MNENTTKGEKMDKEQIARWRTEIENDIESWGKDYKGMAREDLHGREISILDALEAALARNAELERWKSEASSVLSGIDLQAIASEIGTKLGRDIGPAILPWVKDRKAHIARLEAALVEAEAALVEELESLREIARLVDEARERYDKRPRGAGGQRMPDEIDDLLCRLYEIGAHPALRAAKGENHGNV